MRERAKAPTKKSRGRGRRKRQRPWTLVVAVAGAALSVLVVVSVWWAVRPRAGSGKAVAIRLPEASAAGDIALLLGRDGVVDAPWKFRLLFALTGPFVDLEAGPHLLTDDASPAEVVRRLARLSSRARERVTIPEGYDAFQVAARLEEKRICSAGEFLRAAVDPSTLLALGIQGPSAEGYLFPATYELYLDTRPADVVSTMVRETRRRLDALRGEHAAALAHLEAAFDWSEHEILTLASVVEKEAAVPDERALVASVFFNRLQDPTFRPARMLQSDPTAVYGCRLHPTLSSCSGSGSRVTPAMLRDPQNPYNTYRHPGLPPGPIGSPGLGALRAVLSPAKTDYLFFVASGKGRHAFSRTFEEHSAAVQKVLAPLAGRDARSGGSAPPAPKQTGR